MPDQPDVVTICGSMRFFPQMLEAAAELTAQGCIVLAPFSVVQPEDQGGDFKAMLDRLHFRKIDMSSRIVVVTDQNGYIGDSTRREMGYALSSGKGMDVREFALPGDRGIGAGHSRPRVETGTVAVLARTYDALTELMEYCSDPGPNAFGAIWQAQQILPAKTGPADPWPARIEAVAETARAVRVELENAEQHTEADTVVMAAVRELMDALHHVLPGGTGA